MIIKNVNTDGTLAETIKRALARKLLEDTPDATIPDYLSSTQTYTDEEL